MTVRGERSATVVPLVPRADRHGEPGVAALKAVFGSFVTGVVVATTHGPAGMTCQTFCPVSLDPPLVSVAVNRRSAAGERFRSEGEVCFNVLERTGADLAQRFATPGIDRFAGLRWSRSPVLGLPLLDRTVGWVEGRVEEVVAAGDHHLLIARVVGLGTTPGEEPLAYFRGRFSGLTGPDGAGTASGSQAAARTTGSSGCTLPRGMPEGSVQETATSRRVTRTASTSSAS